MCDEGAVPGGLRGLVEEESEGDHKTDRLSTPSATFITLISVNLSHYIAADMMVRENRKNLQYSEDPMATPSTNECTQRATVVRKADYFCLSSFRSLFVIGVIIDN